MFYKNKIIIVGAAPAARVNNLHAPLPAAHCLSAQSAQVAGWPLPRESRVFSLSLTPLSLLLARSLPPYLRGTPPTFVLMDEMSGDFLIKLDVWIILMAIFICGVTGVG